MGDRRSHLRELLEEFEHDDSSLEAKRQVLANLANFSYDPANSKHIRELGVLDAFINELQRPTDVELTHFACAGICNLCLDRSNADRIIKSNTVVTLKELVTGAHEETALNAITTLFYLTEQDETIVDLDLIENLIKLSDSENARFRNLAVVFLEDACDKQAVEEVKKKRIT